MLTECSYSGHQSPYYCLRESFYCSHLFTCSTNNPSTPQEELGLNQVFLLGFCIPFLRLLIIHVKKWCFFTAFSLSPLQVPVTSLCRLPSSCLLFFSFHFTAFPTEQCFLDVFSSQTHHYILPLRHPFLYHYRSMWFIIWFCNLGMVFNSEFFLKHMCKAYV